MNKKKVNVQMLEPQPTNGIRTIDTTSPPAIGNTHVVRRLPTTKQERLNELKAQDQFYKVLDKYFDAGWKSYVKGIQQENDVSNVRMFKILAALKGNEFVADLIRLMGKHHKHAYLELTKKPKGILLKDSRFKTIPELMIDKYTAGSYHEGKVYIQVKPDRWVGFVF